MRDSYLDLRLNDRLIIMGDGGLEVTLYVRRLDKKGGISMTRTQHGNDEPLEVRAHAHTGICRGVTLINMGYRHHGRRSHIRLKIPNSYSYRREK